MRVLYLICFCFSLFSCGTGDRGAGGGSQGSTSGDASGSGNSSGGDSTTGDGNTDTPSMTLVTTVDRDLNSTFPGSLILDGGQLIASDRLSDCPNQFCLLTQDSAVQAALQAHTAQTSLIDSSVSFSRENYPFRNYFKTRCLTTPKPERYQTVSWQNCTRFITEAFTIKKYEISTSVSYTIHPSQRKDLCLSLPESLSQGVQVFLDSCEATNSQKWIVDEENEFALYRAFRNTQLCLLRGRDSRGNNVMGLWTCQPEEGKDISNTQLMFEKL